MTFRKILVPVDGSPPSNKALTVALQMARERGAQVRVLHAIDELVFMAPGEFTGDMIRAARAQAEEVLDAAIAICQSAGIECDRRLADEPGQRLGQTVADEADLWGADLVVVGTHGRRGFSRALLGSGAEQVIRMATVPVLVVRDPEAART